MAGSMALYSTSPARQSSSLFDIDSHSRSQTGQHQGPRHAAGGLSSLFGTLTKTSSGSSDTMLDSSGLSSYSSGIMKSRSYNDLCIARDLGTESRPAGVNIPFSASSKFRECSPVSSKFRECSPVSVLQSPSSYGSNLNSSFTDSHFGLPRRYPLSRDERSHIQRVQSWSSFTPKAVPLSIDHLEICESFNSESLSDGMDILFQVDNDLGTITSDEGDIYGEIDSCREMSDPFLYEETHTVNSHYGSTSSSRILDSPSVEESIFNRAASQHDIFKDPIVEKAFKEAEKAHRGQFRATGDPYIQHCVETAMLLAAAGGTNTVVAAGLLHDILDDCSWDQKQLRETFGDDVADLVTGVSRLSELSQLARDNNLASKQIEADRMRTMFLAMVDVRVVLIKLADRLHNMRTLGVLCEEKQKRIANETMQIFAPLANRLGIWSWKAEMEDLCFRYLKPYEHKVLKEEIAKSSREATMISAIQKLDQALRQKCVSFHDLCGRSKNLYGIFSKMIRKSLQVHEIHDVRGLRLIVSDKDSCYVALNTVHQLWSPMSEKVKDYISFPKSNGYQSLHTVVIADDGLPLEIQIRTMEMHHQAEFGVAAHWRYKENNSEHSSSILQLVEWARWVLMWHSELLDTRLRISPLEKDLRPPCPFPFHIDECPHSTLQGRPPDCKDDPMFVIILEREKMQVQELSFGSTVADLVTSFIRQGNSFSSFQIDTKLKINHEIINDLTQELHMGDLIELGSFFTAEVLEECREKIKRMYEDVAYVTVATKNLPNSAVSSIS